MIPFVNIVQIGFMTSVFFPHYIVEMTPPKIVHFGKSEKFLTFKCDFERVREQLEKIFLEQK